MRDLGTELGRSLVRRVARLDGDETPAFAALSKLIDAADIKREGMATTSFDVAMTKFTGSFTSESHFEKLVDLATGLEAALLGGGPTENEGVTLRLRTRASALLATPTDPAIDVFKDVNTLYSIRSSLVHGGQLDRRKLERMVGAVTSVPEENKHQLGVALVSRSIACATWCVARFLLDCVWRRARTPYGLFAARPRQWTRSFLMTNIAQSGAPDGVIASPSLASVTRLTRPGGRRTGFRL